MSGKALLNDKAKKWIRNSAPIAVLVVGGVVFATNGGCDKVKDAAKAVGDTAKDLTKKGTEAGKDLVDKGKGLVDKGKQAAKAIDTNGFFEIKAEGDINASACYAMLVESVAGRQSLLQLRSYTKGGQDYPAVLVHAPVEAAALEDLIQQKIEARMFIRAEDGTVWDNVDSDPVTLTIDSVGDKELKATFTGGQLRNSKTGKSHLVTGSLTAVISP